jgi:sugar phosphate isomerase/epimerase
MHSRRDFARLAVASAAALPLAARPDSKVRGVRVGVQTYSFRDRPLDQCIEAIADIGLNYAELWAGHLEPGGPKAAADELRKWRTAPATMQQIRDVRRKFNKAGIRVYALSYNLRAQHSDDEIRACMNMAKELGTKYLTSSSTVDHAARLNRFARESGVIVAMHNHSNLKDPNEFATPDSFARAMAGNDAIRVNLDIGHYVAAGFDPVEYLQRHADKVVTLHIKDRRKDQGANVPFGQGDTPIAPVLTLLRDRRLAIPAMIEYEYKGADAVEEVRKSYEYMRQALLHD